MKILRFPVQFALSASRRVILMMLFATSCIVSLSQQHTKVGIDNLVDTRFEMLSGKKVVLVSHAAARCYTGRNTAEEFIASDSVKLIRILTPEHGFFGVVQAGKPVSNDRIYGVETVSLYGELRKPGAKELQGADVVVIDFQDIGSRSYTYISTATEVLVACAELNIPVVILDRPNPLGGLVVDGNTPHSSIKSFIARLPIPYVHGMTMGELCTMSNGEGWLGNDSFGVPLKCTLTVVKCKRWTRDMTWEQTGLPWYPTSPNIPTVNSARGYAVTGILGELGFVSIGIGGPNPFTVIGSPNFSLPHKVISELRSNGVYVFKAFFVPSVGKYAGQLCSGYYLSFSMTASFKPFKSAMLLCSEVSHVNPLSSNFSKSNAASMFNKASGNPEYLDCMINKKKFDCMTAFLDVGLQEFRLKRISYLLY